MFKRYAQNYTIVQIQSPTSPFDSKEATLALVRGSEPDYEFVDHYLLDTQAGMRIQKRGSTTYRDYVWEFGSSDVDVEEVWRLQRLGANSYDLFVGTAGGVNLGRTTRPYGHLYVGSALSPTDTILQVQNSTGATHYFTVSSTSTKITTDIDLDDCTGTVAANAVTCNGSAGVLTDDTDIAIDTTRTTITLTNSRFASGSVVSATLCSAPDAGARVGAAIVSATGSASVYVWNSGTSNQTSTWKLCYTVTN
jgi:hypothetical protein